MALDKKNLCIRALSGAIYIGLIIGAIIWGVTGVALLCSLFAVCAVYELEKNALEDSSAKYWPVYWLVDSVSILCLIWTIPLSDYGSYVMLQFFPGIWIILIAFRFIMQIFVADPNGFKSIAVSLFSQFYICLPLLCFVWWEQELRFSPWVLVALISMIWINDTGAYIVGCSIGKHKMFPRLSPKKSWEGFFGGLAFNIGAAALYHIGFKDLPYPLAQTIWGWFYMGVCITILATLGDLFESMIKRSMQIKDSSHLIPGHGGILDRIDSLLFVCPGLIICYALMNVFAF